jgi:hypothetical protein
VYVTTVERIAHQCNKEKGDESSPFVCGNVLALVCIACGFNALCQVMDVSHREGYIPGFLPDKTNQASRLFFASSDLSLR